MSCRHDVERNGVRLCHRRRKCGFFCLVEPTAATAIGPTQRQWVCNTPRRRRRRNCPALSSSIHHKFASFRRQRPPLVGSPPVVDERRRACYSTRPSPRGRWPLLPAASPPLRPSRSFQPPRTRTVALLRCCPPRRGPRRRAPLQRQSSRPLRPPAQFEPRLRLGSRRRHTLGSPLRKHPVAGAVNPRCSLVAPARMHDARRGGG